MTYVVSESFVVATKRVKHAIKSDIPSIGDHISKLVHIGKATVDKLQVSVSCCWQRCGEWREQAAAARPAGGSHGSCQDRTGAMFQFGVLPGQEGTEGRWSGVV